MENVNDIIMLPTSRLHPHPDNPRKDVGDVTELAESIKANGIMQNLTVVPNMVIGEVSHETYQRGYRVVIGHRRLAAAKQAGLEEVPCVVREMTLQEQIKTMLMENMQRSDLTVYEQAQGFQMMLDMGETVESIAKDSGFSQATVRRRVKLLDLDAEKFRESEARGATLTDYMELDKIEDPELKNRVLDAIGTANFRDELRRALNEEKSKRFVADRVAEISKWATEMDAGEIPWNKYMFVRNYSAFGWKKDSVVEPPNDVDTVSYYFKRGRQDVTIYKDRVEHQESDEDRRRKAHAAAEEQRKAELQEISYRHFMLRKEFVCEFGYSKKFMPEIIRYAARTMIGLAESYGDDIEYERLRDMMGCDVDDNMDGGTVRLLYTDAFDRCPEYVLLVTAYIATDNENERYWETRWNDGAYIARYEANDELDAVYDFLTTLGYEMSDEEKAMQNGTHPLLQESKDDGMDKPADDPCALCKSAHPTCDKCCKTCDDKCNAWQNCRNRNLEGNQ
jgi:ParB family chromosome partitioning protein